MRHYDNVQIHRRENNEPPLSDFRPPSFEGPAETHLNAAQAERAMQPSSTAGVKDATRPTLAPLPHCVDTDA